MNEHDPLAEARQRLSDILTNVSPPIAAPLELSPWTAMSLLQKAIRRGEEELALRAAARLLAISPDGLWRRCGVIAFEDIGVADIEVVATVVAALVGRRFRVRIGGEWAVASFIVSTMARAAKCRAADDLLMTAELNPRFASTRQQLASDTLANLAERAAAFGPLPERAIALWYAIGTGRRRSKTMKFRRGGPQPAFDRLIAGGYSGLAVRLAREGFRKSGEALCAFLPLLEPLRTPAAVQDDDFPPEVLIKGVPGWAYDVYSREGRRALLAFLEGDSATASWVRGHIAPSRRVGFLGAILFRVEGGLVRRRLQWRVGQELCRQVDFECQGVPAQQAAEVLQLMRRDIPRLNAVRADVL